MTSFFKAFSKKCQWILVDNFSRFLRCGITTPQLLSSIFNAPPHVAEKLLVAFKANHLNFQLSSALGIRFFNVIIILC
jgi:hypothetical protein